MTLFRVAVSRPRALSLTGWVATTPTFSCPVVNREIRRERVVNREIHREWEAARQAKINNREGLTSLGTDLILVYRGNMLKTRSGLHHRRHEAARVIYRTTAVPRYGVEWKGMAWHGTARHDMAWHRMAWHGICLLYTSPSPRD